MNWFPPSVALPQQNREELLDSRTLSRAEVKCSLSDVARINSFLGATMPLYEATLRQIEAAGLKRASVLDVGCGNGDFARHLIARGRRRGIEICVLALDILPLHLSIAREMTPPSTQIAFLCADAFAVPLPDEGVDIVTSSLFLHHFRPAQIERLLREFGRVARLGWVMNDCTRDAVALWSFRVLRPYLARSFITRFDAATSIRRAYTVEEMRQIVAPIEGAQVKDLFPYRLQAQWSKTT